MITVPKLSCLSVHVITKTMYAAVFKGLTKDYLKLNFHNYYFKTLLSFLCFLNIFSEGNICTN